MSTLMGDRTGCLLTERSVYLSAILDLICETVIFITTVISNGFDKRINMVYRARACSVYEQKAELFVQRFFFQIR
jgi:hypothetical protein